MITKELQAPRYAERADSGERADGAGPAPSRPVRHRLPRAWRALVAVAAAVLAVVVFAVVALQGTTTSSTSSTRTAGGATDPVAGFGEPTTADGSGAAADARGDAASVPAAAPAGPATGAAAAGSASSSGTASSAGAPGPTGVSAAADRIVRTGDVTLTVPDQSVGTTVDKLSGAAVGLGGFRQDSDVEESNPKLGGTPTAQVTLRVPVSAFDALVTRVQSLGTVLSSTSTGRDVTGQYVDLTARLTSLQTSRGTYLTILSHATNVNDTLAVQQRVDDIQTQIEQLQGEQKTLANQSDLATLAVEVSGPHAVAPSTARSGFSAAVHTAADRFRRGAEAVVAASGSVALVALALALVLLLARAGQMAHRRRAE